MRTVIDLSPVGDDDALADLGGDRVALGGRRAGAGYVVGLHRGAFFAPFVRLRLAPGCAGGGALLDRLRRAGFVRLARTEDAATLLPGKVVERVRLGGLGPELLGCSLGAAGASASAAGASVA